MECVIIFVYFDQSEVWVLLVFLLMVWVWFLLLVGFGYFFFWYLKNYEFLLVKFLVI